MTPHHQCAGASAAVQAQDKPNTGFLNNFNFSVFPFFEPFAEVFFATMILNCHKGPVLQDLEQSWRTLKIGHIWWVTLHHNSHGTHHIQQITLEVYTTRSCTSRLTCSCWRPMHQSTLVDPDCLAPFVSCCAKHLPQPPTQAPRRHSPCVRLPCCCQQQLQACCALLVCVLAAWLLLGPSWLCPFSCWSHSHCHCCPLAPLHHHHPRTLPPRHLQVSKKHQLQPRYASYAEQPAVLVCTQ